MNPVAQQLQRQNPVSDIIEKVRTGQLDPKLETLKALENCTPQQKAMIQSVLPTLQNVAKRAGISMQDIASFSQEVMAKLA